MNEIAALLRALELLAQEHHQTTKGSSFPADHELLGQLYDQYGNAYDKTVETIIAGGDSPSLIDINLSAMEIYADPSRDQPFRSLLDLERRLQDICDRTAKQSGAIAMETYIGQVSADSVERSYKIRQRAAGEPRMGIRDTM